MRKHEDEINTLGTEVLVVTFEADFLARAYAERTQLRWPLLVDSKRELFAAYDMHRGSFWNIMGPASMWIYAKLMLRGRLPRLPKDDVYQLGGDVLIDADGIVRLHHVGSGPADRPSVESILAAIRGESTSHSN